MTFSANPFDMTGTLDTSGMGLASGTAALAKVVGAITGATVALGVVTFTIPNTSAIVVGQPIAITGVAGFTNNPNGNFVVSSVPSATTFTVSPLTAPTGSYSSGGVVYFGTDPGSTSVASVTNAFTDPTLAADAANRVLPGQPLYPTASWH